MNLKDIYKNNKSKYNNKKIKIDGHTFDSLKEATYYNELKLRLAAKDIRGFCIQPQFTLPGEIIYRADFIIFENNGITRIIDVKGKETQVFKLKKKLFKERYPELELELI